MTDNTSPDLEKNDEDENKPKEGVIPPKLLVAIFLGFFIFTAASIGAVYVLLSRPVADDGADTSTQEASSASNTANTSTPATEAAANSESDKPAEGGGEGAAAVPLGNGHKAPANYASIKPPFIINYQVNGRSHYLQVSVDVMSRSENVLSAIEKHSPRIKNDLITLFTQQDFDDLQTTSGKEALRDQALKIIRNIIQEETGLTDVEEVLFTSYVAQ